MLSTAQLAETFGVQRSTILYWVKLGCPVAASHPFSKGAKFYKLSEVSKWAKIHKRGCFAPGKRPPKEIAEASGLYQGYLSRMLPYLVRKGSIIKVRRGIYKYNDA